MVFLWVMLCLVQLFSVTEALCAEDDENSVVPNYKEKGCYVFACTDWSNFKLFHSVSIMSKGFETLRKAVDKCGIKAAQLKYQRFSTRLNKNKVECWREAGTTGWLDGLKTRRNTPKCKYGVGRGNALKAYTILTKSTPSCGKSSFGTHKIVGGDIASPGDWPWQVGIYYNNSFLCGGIIIKPTAILTAAHCLNVYNMNSKTTGKPYDDSNAHLFRVRAGDFDLDTEEDTQTDHEVSMLIMHDKWKFPIPDNDIGMLRLKTPIKFSDVTGPACLAAASEPYPSGKKCYVSGWGKTDFWSTTASRYLREAVMPIVSLEECREKIKDTTDPWLQVAEVTENMVCGGKEGSDVSICHGDSGGPLVCKDSTGAWVLHGITSWTSPFCDSADAFSVFTSTSKYAEWILLNSILRI